MIAGASAVGVERPLCCFSGWFGRNQFAIAHGPTFQRDAVGGVDEPIENGVRQCRAADDVVPAVNRQLAGDQGSGGLVSLLDDFEEIAALVGGQQLRTKVIENQEPNGCQGFEQACVTSIKPC